MDCLDNKYANLCEDCEEIHKINNKNHDIIYFNTAKDLIEEIIKILNDENFKKEHKDNYFKQNFEIINIFIENFEESPCYNYYKSIKNAAKYLYYLIDKKTYKIIYSLENLYNYKGNTDLIDSIIILEDINNKKNQKTLDLNWFENKTFSNLKILIIKYRNIKNINILLEQSLPKLEKIVIEECILEDIDKIDYNKIKLKEFNNLKYISFYKDRITDIKFLNYFNDNKSFQKVKTLYLGGNSFFEEEKKIIIRKNKDVYHFNDNIEEIGLTGNFNKKTIEFLKYCKFNPKKLFISRNELTSLKVIKDYKFERLEEFWATDGEITDLKELENLKSTTVKKISLQNNHITSIDNLEKIIKSFPQLEELNLTNKDIDKKYIEEKIMKIKEKDKKFHLKILY